MRRDADPRDISRHRLEREGPTDRPIVIDPERFQSNSRAERHDRMVWHETTRAIERLREEGGSIQRVVSEKETRAQMSAVANRKVFDGPRTGLSSADRARLADSFSLRVVDGKVRIPDARIEYLDRWGRSRHLDVEVISRSYNRQQIAAKSGAGFHMKTENTARAPIKEKRGSR